MIYLQHSELEPSYLAKLVTQEDSKELQSALQFIIEWIEGRERFIQMTSGSTGKPKEIQLDRELMLISARQTLSFLNLDEGGVSLLCLSVNYIAGKMLLVRALEHKMDLILAEPTSNPLASLKDQKITLCSMVPYQVRTIIDQEGSEAFSQLKNLLVGGGIVDRSLETELARITGCSIHHTYGMTETISHIAMRRLDKKTDKFFQLLPENDIRLSEDGTLQIKGPVTRNQWVNTHDIVKLNSSTQFEFLGRADNVINSGGVKIYPEQVEVQLYTILENLGYQEYMITGVDDKSLGSKVVLIIEGEANKSSQNIRKAIMENTFFPRYCTPKEIFFIPAFKKTKNGKIRRQATAALINAPST